MLKVSVVLPARNEEKHIAGCIESLMNQSYPKELIEVLVVDGMSTDNTRNIVKELIQKYGNIILLKNEKRVTPVSLNIGIKNSSGDIVIILGAHSYVHKDFIKNNVRNITEKGVKCTGGIVEFIHENFLSKCIALVTSSPFGVGNALYRYSNVEQYVDTVPFAAYSKDVFDEIGYFDEELVRNQDDEFNYRVTEKGWKILLSPDIKSYYYSRSSIKKLWKQYFQYGFWKVRVIQKHKRPASIRHLVPMAFVASLLTTLIGCIFVNKLLYLFAFIALSYTAASLVFSVKISIKNGLKCLPYLPLLFFILHFGYGLGFIQGLISFYIIRSKKVIEKNTIMSK